MDYWDEIFKKSAARQTYTTTLLILSTIILTGVFAYASPVDHWATPALPTIIVFSFLTMEYGNPLRWWVAFVGVEVKVNLDRISQEEATHGFDSMRPKIEEWLVETTPKYQYIQINPYRYKFLRKKHATLFKLAWG